MRHTTIKIAVILLVILPFYLYFSDHVNVAAANEITLNTTPSPTFEVNRLAQPATVIPPGQADNGKQIYWAMCIDCHGDQGQGLTIEWLEIFKEDYRDCWKSGCHGADYPENSFGIPATGVPALTGSDKLTRFSNAYELWFYIHENMPYSIIDTLSAKDAWALTAYILSLNHHTPKELTISEVNGAAIPVHNDVVVAKSVLPGVLVLVCVLVLAAFMVTTRLNRDDGKKGLIKANFFHHLHPLHIPKLQSRFRYTLGAGGLAIFCSLILLFTGLIEAYFYIPLAERAPISVQTISTLIPYGNITRNLHYWSGQFLVVIVSIHLLRVMLTGAYASPRRFNYLLGLGLLVLILLINFTGYVLRWDEGIQWALVVGTNLLKSIPWIGTWIYRFVIGGNSINNNTLTHFYAWHIFGLALPTAILVVWHAFRVRRDGGIAANSAKLKADDYIPRNALVRYEVLAMVLSGIILLLISLIFPAPTKQPISNMNTMVGDSQAPWFFLWIQQLLKLGNPFLYGILLPFIVIIVLGLIPYVLPNADSSELGKWFIRGNRSAQILTVLIFLSILFLTIMGWLAN